MCVCVCLERLLPFGEADGDAVIESKSDSRFSQPHSTDISNLRFRFYNVEQEAIYVCDIQCSQSSIYDSFCIAIFYI